MRRTFGWICWALCWGASVSVSAQDPLQLEDQVDPVPGEGSPPETRADFIRCNKAAWCVPGQYLVILRQEAHGSHVQMTVRSLQARAARRGQEVEVLQTYSGAVNGLLVKMDSDVLKLAVKLPHVHYIEEDSSIFAQSAPWNLQRLLQPHGGTADNRTYNPPNDGGEAEVYLMDGSVQSSHREVEGRVFITDFSSVPDEDGVRVHRQASQCDSHATHVAGVVSGSDSGVARGSTLNVVRVLNCQGKGTASGAVAGVQYIREKLRAHPVDAVVVLLPFIGGLSRTLNAACRDLVANGAVVVTSAGNYRDDACLYSPASEPEVITVGAVNSADQLMSQGAGGTNFGRCVDLFAPGDDIVSASSDCSTCFSSSSGTSQAAAHAAGVAAVILSSNQNLSPVQVLHTMLHHSISNTINFHPLSDTHRLVTPNLVAAMPAAYSSNGELLCRSVWSERSGVTGTDTAVSRCRLGEEMMSCSSFSPDGVRAGETITVNRRRMECAAHNSPTGEGVYAVARCCVIAGLQCQAHASPMPGQDAECVDQQHHLTGCSSRSTADILSDPRPHHGDRKRCIVKDGVTAHAVCCHARSLECHLLENQSADEDQVQVSCPAGWTLTDCRAVSQGSALVGPGVKGNSCRVRRTSGAEGLLGIAVCCRVRPPEQPANTPH